MARYYTETLNGRVEEVIAQDASGVYIGGLRSNAKEIVIRQSPLRERVSVKLPEWKDAREVSTTSREYLDFVRRCERGIYTKTTPSDIHEVEGSAEKAITEVLRFQAKGAAVVVQPLPPRSQLSRDR